MDSVGYITWREVGVPKFLVQTIEELESNKFLDFLVLNKVFQSPVRSQFKYCCESCLKTKTLYRIYEDYPKCSHCGSYRISVVPGWRLIRDNLAQYSKSDEYVATIISKVQANFQMYYEDFAPQDFIEFYPKTHDGVTSFFAKFICGDGAESNKPGVAICKAAVLCPFLWDDTFDWTNQYMRESRRKTHITPILHQMATLMHKPEKIRLLMPERSRSGSPFENHFPPHNDVNIQDAEDGLDIEDIDDIEAILGDQ